MLLFVRFRRFLESKVILTISEDFMDYLYLVAIARLVDSLQILFR